ncbi:hypothetical protein B0T17DRAFT_489569, partial [Bombardia bombarda]
MSLGAYSCVQTNGREVETEDSTIRINPSPEFGWQVSLTACAERRSSFLQLLNAGRRTDPSRPDHQLLPFPPTYSMAPLSRRLWPKGTADVLPATYHYYKAAGKRIVGNPAEDTPAFLQRELSLGSLADMLRHLWFAGARRPAMPLHFHAAIGREITVVDRMDLHLLWTSDGRLLVKPIPRFLLDPVFCQSNLQCPKDCMCWELTADACRLIPRRVALGFLYTYAYWKNLARELLQMYEPDVVHPRFLHADINTIHRFTRLPPFSPYLRSWYNYSSLFRDNLAWMAATAIFVALVLTAMQVGLATERLQGDAAFQKASYGFAVFAMLGPICAFGLMVLAALFNLVKDVPSLLRGQGNYAEANGPFTSLDA